MKTYAARSFAKFRLAVLVFSLLTPLGSAAFAQHDVVPGGKHATGREIRNEYFGMVLQGIQILHHDWEKACNHGNVGAMTELYRKNATILTLAGPTVKGRDSVNTWYKTGLPRIRGCRMTYGEIIASGELASINGQIRYDIQLPTGGSIAQTVLFQMTLRQEYLDQWRIESQTGGDLPPIITSLASTGATKTTDADSVGVQITDGLGHPLPNVLVIFTVEQRNGETVHCSCITDRLGRAVAGITNTPISEITRVQVSTSINKEVTFFPIGERALAPNPNATPRGEGAK